MLKFLSLARIGWFLQAAGGALSALGVTAPVGIAVGALGALALHYAPTPKTTTPSQ